MTAVKANAARAIFLPPLKEQRKMAVEIRRAHRDAEVLLRRSLEAVETAKAIRTSSFHQILGGPQGAYSRAWERTFGRNAPLTIRELVKIKQNDRKADFWIQRRGSKHLVGRPKSKYSKYDLGVTVIRKDVLDPTWLFYMTEYAHTMNLFHTASHGTLPLQNVTIPNVYRILTGILSGYRPNPTADSQMEMERKGNLELRLIFAARSYSHSSKIYMSLYSDWQDELGRTAISKSLKMAKKAHDKYQKARSSLKNGGIESMATSLKDIVAATVLMRQATHEIYRYIPSSPIHGAAFGTTPEIPRVITHKNLGPLLDALEGLVTDEGLWDMAHRDMKHWINRSVILEFPMGEIAKGGLHTMGLIGKSKPKVIPLTGKEGFDAQGLEGKIQTRKRLKDAIIALRALPVHRGRILTR